MEVSPHPVLTVGVQETDRGRRGRRGAKSPLAQHRGAPAAAEAGAAGWDRGVVVVGSLRGDEGGLGRFLRSAGELWVAGGGVDWGCVFRGLVVCAWGCRRMRFSASGTGFLPGWVWAMYRLLVLGVWSTRCWVRWSDWRRVGGLCSRAVCRLRVIRGLSDHAVSGVVLLPGTGFLELVLHAGAQDGVPGDARVDAAGPLCYPSELACRSRSSWGTQGRVVSDQ